MDILIKRPTRVTVNKLVVNLPIDQTFICELEGDYGDVLASFNSDLSMFLKECYGHCYIQLQIDIDTGKILNWDNPTGNQISSFLESRI